MAGFKNVQDIVNADTNGQSTFFTWRKSPTQATTAGIWFDLSMSPGNPVPQYYAASPLISVQFKQSTDGGLYHGGAVSPMTKHLRGVMATTSTATALPLRMMVLDYLLYYPFIDEGTTDEQFLTNSVALPRYTDGAGVRIMAVSVAARTGGQSFYVNYTNSEGVAGRISRTVIQNTAAANGNIVTSATGASPNSLAAGPFIPLQTGDTGVRSIESVTMLGGDVGLFTLVLVKPLLSFSLHEVTAPVEVCTLCNTGTLPKIEDDAYLNLICSPRGTMAATTLHGYLNTTWN